MSRGVEYALDEQSETTTTTTPNSQPQLSKGRVGGDGMDPGMGGGGIMGCVGGGMGDDVIGDIMIT